VRRAAAAPRLPIRGPQDSRQSSCEARGCDGAEFGFARADVAERAHERGHESSRGLCHVRGECGQIRGFDDARFLDLLELQQVVVCEGTVLPDLGALSMG
jgi:hypothetical protein